MSKNRVLTILLYALMLLPSTIILKSVLTNDLAYILKGVIYLIFTTSLLFIKGYNRNDLIIKIMFWASVITIIIFDLLIYML